MWYYPENTTTTTTTNNNNNNNTNNNNDTNTPSNQEKQQELNHCTHHTPVTPNYQDNSDSDSHSDSNSVQFPLWSSQSMTILSLHSKDIIVSSPGIWSAAILTLLEKRSQSQYPRTLTTTTATIAATIAKLPREKDSTTYQPLSQTQLLQELVHHPAQPRISSNLASENFLLTKGPSPHHYQWLLQIKSTSTSTTTTTTATTTNDDTTSAFWEYCNTTLEFDYTTVLTQPTKTTILTTLQQTISSCEAGDTVVIHYAGDANEKYIILLSHNKGITELELHSILALKEENVHMTLIWDAIVPEEVFSTLQYQREATTWSKRLFRSFPLEYPSKSPPTIQSVLHSLKRESITISKSAKEENTIHTDNNNNNIHNKKRPSLSQSPIMKSRRQQFAMKRVSTKIPKHHKQITLISACQSNGEQGQCTTAFLEVMRSNLHRTEPYTLAAMLVRFASLSSLRPQLTFSLQQDMYSTFHIVPPNINVTRGCTKRALLIGINYLSLSDVIYPLQDSHTHVERVKQYLFEVEGFLDQHCIKLMDDNKHEEPTKDNILDAFARLARQTNPGDVVVFYFSGYSGRDLNMIFDIGASGDESLCPMDVHTMGTIGSAHIKKHFVNAMPVDITMTCLIDCSNSGGWLDLPFCLQFDDKSMQSYIPTNAMVLSCCGDSSNSGKKEREGFGTCTFLNAIKNDPQSTWISVVNQMKELLDESKSRHLPHLSSTRFIDPSRKVTLSPTCSGASKRALLVGIRYTGQEGLELSRCHTDVENMQKYLSDTHGYTVDEIEILMDDDDSKYTVPLRDTILQSFDSLVASTHAGDTRVFFFAGHGSLERVDALVPLDSYNWIRDDEILDRLIRPLPDGSNLICLLDCCRSVLPLSYSYKPTNSGSLATMVQQSFRTKTESLRKSFELSLPNDSSPWTSFLSGLKQETKSDTDAEPTPQPPCMTAE